MNVAPQPSCVYGPVWSWRFGHSLGLDPITTTSACPFQCRYCQLGSIEMCTTDRRTFVETTRFLADLEQSAWQRADVLTFSGSGEPTLAANLGEMIRGARGITGRPVVVLTNAALLDENAVRDDLSLADHVCCKLDAATEKRFRRINRPRAHLRIENIVRSVAEFRRTFAGKLSIQVMLLEQFDDVASLARLIEQIAPDEIQVSVPSRAVPGTWSVDSRGGHKRFDSERAFRTTSFAAVRDFANALHEQTGVPVRIPM